MNYYYLWLKTSSGEFIFSVVPIQNNFIIESYMGPMIWFFTRSPCTNENRQILKNKMFSSKTKNRVEKRTYEARWDKNWSNDVTYAVDSFIRTPACLMHPTTTNAYAFHAISVWGFVYQKRCQVNNMTAVNHISNLGPIYWVHPLGIISQLAWRCNNAFDSNNGCESGSMAREFSIWWKCKRKYCCRIISTLYLWFIKSIKN